jgi:hypothetical protein
MWIIQKNAMPDEQQDSDQGLQISFRSGGMVIQYLYPNNRDSVNHFWEGPPGGDIIWQKPNISQLPIH